jgi:cysteine desulfurase/selenocysteine lyase
LTAQVTPLNYGGGAIRNVEFSNTEFLDYPHHLEAGTANIAGVIGLGAAIDFVQQLDLNETTRHTGNLSARFLEGLQSLGNFKRVGNPKNFGSIVSFQAENIHPHDVASFLAASNIAVRAGHHCAQPLLESMGVPATVRVSFSIYNTQDDVDKTIAALGELKKFWS